VTAEAYFFANCFQPLTAIFPFPPIFRQPNWSRKDLILASNANTSNAAKQSPTAFNHLKHGASSKTLFLPDENPQEFFDLLDDAFAEHRPGSKQASGIVTRTVHDHWVLLRRERAADNFEVNLHLRLPDSCQWTTPDLHQMELLDRYRTTAARAYSRSLRDLANCKKMKHDEQRWQQNLELQKQKFALQLERFNLSKKKQEAEPPPPANEHDSFDDDIEAGDIPEADLHIPTPGSVTQNLYIGLEGDRTVIYEVTPSNDQLRSQLTASDIVTRIYHFVGGVPPEYQHLITPDAAKWGKSTTVTKVMGFWNWRDLADLE